METTGNHEPGAGGLTRRSLLLAGGAGIGTLSLGGLLSACGGSAAAPAADLTLRARPATVDIGGRAAKTWAYDGRLPGREVRLTAGKPARIRLVNELEVPTSIHWHGIRLENAADGVPGFTQDAVAPGKDFLYTFTPPDPGTFFLHSHFGVQLDRGLYAPLVIEPRRETLDYDQEAVLMFDDWLDGLAGTPDERLKMLGSSGMAMGGPGVRLGALKDTALDGSAPEPGSLARLGNELQAGRLDPGDVRDYPAYLVNGRPPQSPTVLTVARGQRIRLRLINPSADTVFRVSVEGHAMHVVAADGVPVKPVSTDALLLGMGERYDVLVEAKASGVARIVGLPLGKRGVAIALMRYRGSSTPAPDVSAAVATPARVLAYSDLRSRASAPTGPAREVKLDLTFGGGPYVWKLGGQVLEDSQPIEVARGEHMRFVIDNRSAMPHPMHLHGHNFSVNGAGGVVKDTALALPRQRLTLDWVADNPGTWAFHCHNAYHQEAGMMRRVVVS